MKFLTYLIFAISILCFFMESGTVTAQDYYIDFNEGKDANDGKTLTSPWKSFVNVGETYFDPGDNILLKRGSQWEETLVVSLSGTEKDPITIGAYGTGDNPLIKCSTAFSKWSLYIDDSNKKIWKGSISGVKTSLGAMKNNILFNKYFEYAVEGSELSAPADLESMKDGYFFSPLNNYTFYLRNDDGNPGNIEVGSRPNTINVKESKNVVIDSIDSYGISGADSNSGTTGLVQVIVKNSNNIIIKNCTLSYNHSGGAVIGSGSSNCTFYNVTSFKHGSTGLYFANSGSGNKAIACKVYDCGYTPVFKGDQGSIGIWNTPDVTIDKCYVSGNGYKGDPGIDAAVSFVQSPNGAIVRSHVKNSGGIGILFAEGSNNSIAAYNIIDKWAVLGETLTDVMDFGGIHIGAGNLNILQNNFQIYNNLFINGGMTSRREAALLVRRGDYTGIKVKNNIFYNNIGAYDVYAQSPNSFKEWEFSNNLYFRKSGNAISWNDKIYDFDHIIGVESGYFSFDQKLDLNSIVGDPLLTDDKLNIKSDSPCINRGVWVGLNEDYYGNPVTEDGMVDIGPFELSDVSTPKPPSGLRIE